MSYLKKIKKVHLGPVLFCSQDWSFFVHFDRFFVYLKTKMEKISKNKKRGRNGKKKNNYHYSNVYKFNIWHKSRGINKKRTG